MCARHTHGAWLSALSIPNVTARCPSAIGQRSRSGQLAEPRDHVLETACRQPHREDEIRSGQEQAHTAAGAPRPKPPSLGIDEERHAQTKGQSRVPKPRVGGLNPLGPILVPPALLPRLTTRILFPLLCYTA